MAVPWAACFARSDEVTSMWEREFLWDIEWIGADGTPLKQKHGLTRELAERQAQQWLTAKPGSRVYLYRRHDVVTVLVQILTEPGQKHARRDD